MKNKARCIHLKKIFACCALVFLLFSISVPCFAIEVTVEADGWGDLGYTYDIASSAPTNFSDAQIEGYFSIAQTELVIELADEMYKSNAFNGAKPVLITLTRSEYGFYVLFWCNEFNLRLPSYNQIYVEKGMSQSGRLMGFYLPSDYNVQSLQPYAIYLNGSTRRSNISNAAPVYVSPYYDVETDTTMSLKASWYYAYYNGSSWVYDDNDPFCACNNAESVNYAVDEFTSVLDQWQNANKGTIEVDPVNVFEYELDIPSIITSIPNGAKQIINNAFGFEIFGINVAGLLSVLLIVAIVGFVVKWLMSR